MAAVDVQGPWSGGTAEKWQRLKRSGPYSRNPVADEPDGSWPVAKPAAHGRDCNGENGDTADADGFDDCDLEASLRQFLEILIGMIDPEIAEVVWRAEILDQPTLTITYEMHIDEETVIARLRAGRRTLRDLIMLALLPSFERQS